MKKVNKIFISALLVGLSFQPLSVLALTKKETIYTNLDYTGSPYKSVVNNHLYVNSKDDINDQTELHDILNINGEEKFYLQGNSLKWENSGKDIVYQGTTKKDLPLTINATYYLNGKKFKANEILGKKGNITIKLSFTNNSYVYRDYQKLYTPMVATVGTIMNNKDNSNFSITNGKVIDTGTKNILVAIAAPGLYESTNLEEVKSLDETVITYDTTNFSLNDIYIIATPKLLSNEDFTIFGKVDYLSSSINSLKLNMDKVNDGARVLELGANSLADGMTEIVNNLKVALAAVDKLEVGSQTLDVSIKQIIATLDQTKKMLNDESFTSSIRQLQELKEQNDDAIINLSNANSSLEDVYNNNNLSDYHDIDSLISSLTDLGIEESTIQNLIVCKKTYEGNNNLISLLNANNIAISKTMESLTNLPNNIKMLIDNLNLVLTKVEVGTQSLNDGLNELKLGVDKLYNGSMVLKEGTNTLNSGIQNLSNGVTILNKEGISKLNSYANKLKMYSDKGRSLVELSQNYQGYTSNNATNTMFIYKMNSLK
ncbi:MAG: hypothetical protein V8Q75_01235 [Bacilli bacterium]